MGKVDLPVRPPLEPMLAKAQAKVPVEPGVWSYEPKWDGFRSIIFRGGDEVEIGSGCVVRHSYVGPQSRLADLSKLRGSVLGQGAITLVDTNLVEIVSLGGGTLANLLLRETILGRNVFLTTGVLFQTDALDGTIHVEQRGQWVDSGRRQLGGCVGHGAVLGARTIVAPGRALPNRVVVVMRKEEGVQRIPTLQAGTPVCWDRAALVPVAELNGGQTPEELLP